MSWASILRSSSLSERSHPFLSTTQRNHGGCFRHFTGLSNPAAFSSSVAQRTITIRNLRSFITLCEETCLRPRREPLYLWKELGKASPHPYLPPSTPSLLRTLSH